MDGLTTIMVFCSEGKDIYADEICAMVSDIEHPPIILSITPEKYKCGKVFFSQDGTWNLCSLSKTRDLWMSIVVALRGDVLYSEDTLDTLFASANQYRAVFCYKDGVLLGFSSPRGMLSEALDRMLIQEYLDENDWRGMVNIMTSLYRGRVLKHASDNDVIGVSQ